MDTTPEAKAAPHPRRLSVAERDGHVAAWKSSGQSARAYGQLHGLEPWRLYAWNGQRRHRHHGAACDGSACAPARFVSLSWPPPGSVPEAATVTLRHAGLEFVIAGVRDCGEIAGLLRAIRREVLDV